MHTLVVGKQQRFHNDLFPNLQLMQLLNFCHSTHSLPRNILKLKLVIALYLIKSCSYFCSMILELALYLQIPLVQIVMMRF